MALSPQELLISALKFRRKHIEELGVKYNAREYLKSLFKKLADNDYRKQCMKELKKWKLKDLESVGENTL